MRPITSQRRSLARDQRWIPVSLIFVLLAGCGGVGARPGASVDDMPSEGPVGRTMESNSKRFISCGLDSVSIQTGTVQKLELSFIVDAQGRVRKPDVVRMSAPDPDLYDCVRRVLRNTRFPVPKDGKPKKIRYPLTLRPE